MIDIKLVIYIGLAILSIGGAIVTFFQMQTRQNMKIAQLQKDIEELKRKQSIATSNQIKTEKDLVAINVKLEQILEAINDLKSNGHP